MVERTKARQQSKAPRSGHDKTGRDGGERPLHPKRNASMFVSETKSPPTRKSTEQRSSPQQRSSPRSSPQQRANAASESLGGDPSDLSDVSAPAISSDGAHPSPPEHDWVFGIHAVKAFLETRAEEAEEMILQEQGQRTHSELVRKAQDAGVLVRYRPRSFLDRLLPQCNHQGVALQRRRFVYTPFDSILAMPPEGALLLLAGIQDPGNVGAILRSARAFGVRAILLSQRDTCPINQAVYKASVGAIESLQIAQVRKPIETITALKEAGWWVLGLAPGGGALEQFDLCRPLVFVLGAEGTGLKPSIQKHCDALLGIPMSAGWDSLNVSVSGGIALYEWQRQSRKNIALDNKTQGC